MAWLRFFFSKLLLDIKANRGLPGLVKKPFIRFLPEAGQWSNITDLHFCQTKLEGYELLESDYRKAMKVVGENNLVSTSWGLWNLKVIINGILCTQGNHC